jgi:predicted transcriptional regulator of viral defense system
VPAPNRTRIYNAPLSAREVALLAGWERTRQSLVTLQDVRDLVGAKAAKDTAARLVKKQVLHRVGAGRFLVRPLRALGRRSVASAPVTAAAILQGEPYYLGGLWALTFHRLTDQQYSSVVDVFVARRHAASTVGAARLLFHKGERARLLNGFMEAEIEGAKVRVSTPERTLLDLLDRPVLVGGIAEALRLVQQALPLVSVGPLVEQAAQGSRPSTCQRVGVLLERAGVSPRKLAPLRRRLRETKSLLSLVEGNPRTGSVNPRWRVVENDR